MLPEFRPKDPLTREPKLPQGYPSIGDLESSWSPDMAKWLKNAKNHTKQTKDAANRATSGCAFCWTCGTALDKKFPACKVCKIPFHPKIEEARMQMHKDNLMIDEILGGDPSPSVHHYLSECRAKMDEITWNRKQNKITEEQKWAEIEKLMIRHDKLMDLSCYNSECVPPKLSEFLSQGDIEGANGKGCAERGQFHSAYSNMTYEIKQDKGERR